MPTISDSDSKRMLKFLLRRAADGSIYGNELETLHRLLTSRDAAFDRDIALRAAQFGYFKWPVQIRNHIRGRRILEIGCGSGTDGIAYTTLGAREYVGIDPSIKLDSNVVKNRLGPRRRGGRLPKETFGWSPRQINEAMPQIKFFAGSFEEMTAQHDFQAFDVASAYTVTEHLIQIDEVFAGIAALLKKSGKLIYYHHNFYCWNGHHELPKRVQDMDENDPEQQLYMDWRHVKLDPPPGHKFHGYLNRIRLDELRQVTEKHFSIETWEEVQDSDGLQRLTDEIRADLIPAYSERELTTAKVFCVATKR